MEQSREISSDLGSPWCYSWCDHFDVRAKHYRWGQRCQSWYTDIHAQMSCKPIEHIFGDLCRARVQQNHVGTFRHAQVWAEGNEEHDHEPVSGMWSKGERSAQTLGLLGVILGVNRKYPGFLLSHLSGLASRLDLSNSFPFRVLSKIVIGAWTSHRSYDSWYQLKVWCGLSLDVPHFQQTDPRLDRSETTNFVLVLVAVLITRSFMSCPCTRFHTKADAGDSIQML